MTQEKLPHRKELCLQSEAGAIAPAIVADKLFRAVHSHNSNQSYTLHYDALTLWISDLRAVQ